MKSRVFAAGVAVVCSAAGVIAVGPSAQAGTTPSSITVSACNAGASSASVTSSSVSWTSPTDTLTVVNNCSSGGGTSMSLSVWRVVGGTQFSAALSITNGNQATTSALGSDVTEIRIYQFIGPGNGALLATVAASSPSTGGGGTPATSSDASPPAPIVQQFGKPASDTCDATAPESMNWSGVTSGGWGESWAEWMNGGAGGAVCTRTLVFSTSQSRWVVV